MNNVVSKEDKLQMEAKYQLIQTKIINPNYDRQLFFTFCINTKPNGDDLSLWTLEELSNSINQFIQSQNNLNSIEQKKCVEDININLNKLKEQTMSLTSLSYSSTYIKEITCNKIPKSQINDIPIKVILTDPKLIEGSLLLSNYITYKTSTSHVNWLVRRRYSDFIQLRIALVNSYPKQFIPPIPDKQIGSKRFESTFVRKRMKFLQLFLDNVVENELLKASEPLIVFLSENNRIVFDNIMNKYSIYTPQCDILQTLNLTGIILTTSDNIDNEQYQSNIDRYINMNEIILERLDNNMNNFYHCISSAVHDLKEIQEDFETLHMLNTKVSMKEEITRSYEELTLFFKNWRKILNNQNEIISDKIHDFFKYIKMESIAYKELIKGKKELKDLYEREYNKLMMKKEYQWDNILDFTKWNISQEILNINIDQTLLLSDKRYAFEHMNTIETRYVENIDMQLCYANKSNIDELKKLITRYSFSYIDMIKQFTDEMYPSLNNTLNTWTTLASITDTLN